MPACLAWPSRRAAAFCPSLGVIGAAGKGLHLLPRPRIGPRFGFWTSQRPWSKPWSTSERRALSSGGHFSSGGHIRREGASVARAPSSGGHLRREGTFAGRKLSPAWALSPGGHFRREGVGDERRGKDGRREGARRAETHVRRAETSARRERLERTHSSALRGEASARGEQLARGATRPWGARQRWQTRGCSTSGDACASRRDERASRETGENTLECVARRG